MTNFVPIATQLIQAVGGIECEKNIEGVVKVFEGIMNGVHNQWADHLATEATDYLLFNDVLCECGRLIDIKLNTDVVAAKKQ